MSARLRQALVQAAHLIADALEADHDETTPAAPKKIAPPRPRVRKARAPYVPPNVQLSEVDRARARQAAKRAGIPIR